MSFSDFLENKLLDHVFGGTAYSAPATLYVGLSTTPIADDGSGITEPVGGSYARAAVTNSPANWPAAAAGLKSNGTAITFPQATAGWGTATHAFISDAASGGNYLVGGALATARTVNPGDTLRFDTGEIDLALD